MKTVLFVCTGNTCRSPMAEALFNHRAGADAGWRAASAGLHAGNGCPASENAVRAMRELGLDLSGHHSKPLTAEIVGKADLIVPMTACHRDQILRCFPADRDKVYLIKSFGTSKVPADVSDPFGGSFGVYRKTRDEIDRALSDLIIHLRTGNHEQPGKTVS